MHPIEKKVVPALSGKTPLSVEEVAEKTGLDSDSVRKAFYWLEEKKLVSISEESFDERAASEEGLRFLGEGFPEQRVLKKAISSPNGVEPSAFSPEEMRVGIPWAKRNGWIEFAESAGKKLVRATEAGRKARQPDDELLLRKIAEGKPVSSRELSSLENLSRRGLVAVRKRSRLSAVLSGKPIPKEGDGAGDGEVGSLSREMLVSGSWKGKKFREYDVEAPAEKIFCGKPHPLNVLRERIRRVFLELGFREMQGPSVESSFWNFDALFQPQDHPARDLQDTFYVKQPSQLPLPPREFVSRVAKSHEKGWKYEWDEEKAKAALLRTHTTAVSARCLAEICQGKSPSPAKYFSIGRVYRNEATDFKHLAEFQMVEGIVVWEKANFRHLLGLLKEFYSKLGFKKIRFRPHYFPYTEPSLEIDAFFKEKNAWIEMGGAGVFRKEVCLPLWGKYPVLAWGLSLERPLMLLSGLKDIRTIYRSDISWLRQFGLGEFHGFGQD